MFSLEILMEVFCIFSKPKKIQVAVKDNAAREKYIKIIIKYLFNFLFFRSSNRPFTMKLKWMKFGNETIDFKTPLISFKKPFKCTCCCFNRKKYFLLFIKLKDLK